MYKFIPQGHVSGNYIDTIIKPDPAQGPKQACMWTQLDDVQLGI